MIALKLAYRNLVGAGLRTWLNVFVLSISFVIIIWNQGLMEGWNRQAKRETIDWEIGGGQYWHEKYDPYDPFTIEESHGAIPSKLAAFIQKGAITPVLISQAVIYPDGRIKSVLLKGIDPQQNILKIPAASLDVDIPEIPAVIGARMAKSTKLKVGDYVTVRWRDANGTFDAQDIKIVNIMKTDVPSIDNAQLWIPLDRLQKMLQLGDEATLLVTANKLDAPENVPGWIFRDHGYLFKEIDEMIKSKNAAGSILFIILLLLAMLAIFDTQVLAIFRRRREIGTLIALGMTRARVVRMFTIEGAMHGILAAILAAVYGIPLLTLQAVKGFHLPEVADEMGFASVQTIFPVYGAALVIGTTVLILITVTIVSFLPARRISKMNPTDAIRGKTS